MPPVTRGELVQRICTLLHLAGQLFGFLFAAGFLIRNQRLVVQAFAEDFSAAGLY